MSDTFTIKIDGDGGDMRDCRYQPQGADFSPGIRINPSDTYINKDRCHAILRELAKRSDEGTDGIWTFSCDRKKLVTVEHTYTETWLENALWELCKVKYQPIPMTDKERIEKALTFLKSQSWNDSSHLDNAIKILEGEG